MKIRLNVAVFFAIILFAADANAQFGDWFGFGKNKVQYRNFNWSVIKTKHFDVYFYEEERTAAEDAARIAERSYEYLSEVLGYKFKHKIPLILYDSHNAFQQTNAVSGFISEGTQGVTESIKGRIVLPITGSYAQFTHVLTHEIVHAFQFDIMMVSGPTDLVRRFNPPLWFIEGMAEYLSIRMDNITRMWMRDAVLANTIPSIPEMEYIFDIRVYRIGQAIWYYVGERYGKEIVGRIFKTARATGDIGLSFKAHTGLGLLELSKRIHEDAIMRYLPKKKVLEKPGTVAKKITDSHLGLIPSLSPDGTSIAYVADKNFSLRLFLKELRPGGKTYEIAKSGGTKYHSLRYFDTSINWTPDGKYFAFVSKAGKNDAIYVIDAEKKKVAKKISFDEISNMSAPSWSPDGKQIAFSGLHGGIANLYISDANGENLVQLTNDRYAYLNPAWSPDGRYIAFATDRGPYTFPEELIFGGYNLALYDIKTGKIELLTETDGNYLNPVWKSKEKILFVSDKNGIPNVYAMNIRSREIRQITEFITGVSGIITESPAITVARDSKTLAFSAFFDGRWNIYLMDDYEETELAADAPHLEPIPSMNEIYVDYTLPDTDSLRIVPYRSRLLLDFLGGAGSFATNYGAAGQLVVLWSDMLGDKNLLLRTVLYGNPLESTILVNYFNMKRRINWMISAYQFRYASGLYSYTGVSASSLLYRGFEFAISRPFNRFTRLEAGNDFYIVNQKVVSLNFFTGTVAQASSRTVFLNNTSLSLIRDTSLWGFAAPVSGTRARVSINQTTGNLWYTFLFVDYRKYFPLQIPRYSLAFRVTGGHGIGPNKRIFAVGGPFTFRGSDYGDISGTSIFFSNAEARFPLFPYLPMEYDFITALAFFDAAGSWGQGFAGSQFNNTRTIRTSYGFGIRFNLGNLLLLRWDFPLKKEPGAPGIHFSIGFDF